PLQFSPDARLLVSGHDRGAVVWDVAYRRELVQLEDYGFPGTCLHPDGSIITSGSRGVYRWPVSPDPENPMAALCIGPPKQLHAPSRWLEIASLDRAGRTLALAVSHVYSTEEEYKPGKIVLRDLSEPNKPPLDLDCTGKKEHMEVSPDGRWVAAERSFEHDVFVFDTRSPKAVWISKEDRRPAFSPDGQWLVTWFGQECRLRPVGNWDRVEKRITCAGEGT